MHGHVLELLIGRKEVFDFAEEVSGHVVEFPELVEQGVGEISECGVLAEFRGAGVSIVMRWQPARATVPQ